MFILGFSEIGFVWVCIGFVLTKCRIVFILISHFIKEGCAHLGLWEIGFVLHKRADL